MSFIQITPSEKENYNATVSHPLQAYEWGEFREKTGIRVIRRGVDLPAGRQGSTIDGFQLTLHKIPHTPWNIGYLPKGKMPSREVLEELQKIGESEKCVFIQLEPNVVKTQDSKSHIPDALKPSAHPLFTKYTFLLDLTRSEEELLKNMHPKTRYNIRVAEKRGVTIQEDDSDEAFEEYLRLTWETTKRQGFYAHTKEYHRLMWETLRIKNTKKNEKNELSAHLLTARYNGKILVAWIVFVFHDTLYYPYGASSNENREVMASNAMMWGAIRFGKKMGLKKFDMWGSLGHDADPKDPWHGFHRFKQGYGPELVEFIGSYDLIIHPALYQLYKLSDKIRWLYLRMKRR